MGALAAFVAAPPDDAGLAVVLDVDVGQFRITASGRLEPAPGGLDARVVRGFVDGDALDVFAELVVDVVAAGPRVAALAPSSPSPSARGGARDRASRRPASAAVRYQSRSLAGSRTSLRRYQDAAEWASSRSAASSARASRRGSPGGDRAAHAALRAAAEDLDARVRTRGGPVYAGIPSFL